MLKCSELVGGGWGSVRVLDGNRSKLMCELPQSFDRVLSSLPNSPPPPEEKEKMVTGLTRYGPKSVD